MVLETTAPRIEADKQLTAALRGYPENPRKWRRILLKMPDRS